MRSHPSRETRQDTYDVLILDEPNYCIWYLSRGIENGGMKKEEEAVERGFYNEEEKKWKLSRFISFEEKGGKFGEEVNVVRGEFD